MTHRAAAALLLWAVLWPGVPWAAGRVAEKQTVCTITVNSADEKEAFRRHLPASRFRFVELVERGRPDWLASACRAAVSCDVLVISGHYDGQNAFFSDQLESREHLPVDELERVSCSESCTGLFAQLKEVHLFGCNTLNTEAQNGATAEIVRGLVREGHTLKRAEAQLRALNAGHGESSRDRMRQVFHDVPVIYGFSSVAPLGPVAAVTLNSYFRARGARDIGQGRASAALLAEFAPYGMSMARGMTRADPHAAVRQDVCQFVDDRLSDAERLSFVHQLLQRDTGQARVHLERIRRTTAALQEPQRQTPELDRARELVGKDTATRTRFLNLARDADQPAVRARMVKVARELGWLSEDQRRDELAQMLGELLESPSLGTTEVNLACTLNQEGELDGAYDRGAPSGPRANDLPHAAVRACLGSEEGHRRVFGGLLSQDPAEMRIAQDYFRHRPITDPAELRELAAGIARMPPSDAQVRALETLGRHYVADRQILDGLLRLYAQTPSAPVQAAIAGILMRADRRAIASPQLVRTLMRQRRPAAGGNSMVDALIHRLQSP